LLNFYAEKRDHILLMVSWGGRGFRFFLDFDLLLEKGAGGGLLLSCSESLVSTSEDIFSAQLDIKVVDNRKYQWQNDSKEETVRAVGRMPTWRYGLRL
jgi:hypothetical protein